VTEGPASNPNAAAAPPAERVGAVIVTYFPDRAGLHLLLQTVEPQVDRVVVVDNTPGGSAASFEDTTTRTTLTNGANVGLAAAQNQGIAALRVSGCTQALLLDQDSLPARDMVERLQAALRDLQRTGVPVAAVGPRWVDRHSGRPVPFVRLGWGRMQPVTDAAKAVECDALVASGCLIPLAIIDAVGGMEDALFIDQVDTEWGLRAQAHGYRLYGVSDAVLAHGIGETAVRPWFAPSRWVPVHSPVRNYYLVRNTLALFTRRETPWRWRLLHLLRLPGLLLMMLTQMPGRRERASAVARGILDALLGRLGAADSAGDTPPDRLTANIGWLYVLQALNLALPLISVPYLARTLGIEAFGQMAVALAVAQYLALFTDYGFNLSATRRVAQALSAGESIAPTFWQTLWAKVVLGAIALVALVAVWALWPTDGRAALLAAAIAAPSSVVFPLWYLQASQRMAALAGTLFAGRLIAFGLLFVLVRGADDVSTAVVLTAGAPLIAGGFAWTLLARALPAFEGPRIAGIADALRDGWSAFVSAAAMGAYMYSTVPILRVFADDRTVGLYAAAEKLVRAAHSALVPILQAAYPHVNALFARSREDALRFLRRLGGWLIAAGAAISAACILFAEFVVTLLFGDSFAPAAGLLMILAPVPLIAALSNLLGTQTLLTFGHHRRYAGAILGSALFFLAVAPPLAYAWTAHGMAAATLLTEVAVVLAMLFALRTTPVRLLQK
jgi:L-rhamnosyltransferase